MEDRPNEAADEAVQADAAARVARLNQGQLDVLKLVDQHMSSKEIGAQLGISPHTVDQRIRTAIRILQVSRRQEAARLVALTNPYQRLIHQSPYIDASADPAENHQAIGYQIRHADREEEAGASIGLDTEQRTSLSRSPSVFPWSTKSSPRNEMSVGQRLLWIALIAMGASFSAGMYLAGLESLARLAGR